MNDQHAWINHLGNLSLGSSGLDDAAAHATYGYAKNDVTLPVSGLSTFSDQSSSLAYVTGDIVSRVLAASLTHKVMIPFPQHLIRSYAGVSNAQQISAAPHGMLIKSLALAYRVNTTTITSFNTMAINTAPLAAAAGLPSVTALTSSIAGNTLTAAANTYLAVSTVTTPAFVTVSDTLIWGLATIVIPGSSTVDILGASWRVALAIY